MTRSLGPFISTIDYMVGSIKVFLLLWLLLLFGFTTIGILVFREVEELKTMESGVVYFLNAAFASYDLSVFDIYLEPEHSKKFTRIFGTYYILFYVFLNVLVLINVIIAMMSDTYTLMISVRRGLYNYKIMEYSVAYKLDKYYGGLILMSFPLAPVSFCLLPYYALVKDK